jgi:hypothetical protein
MSDESHALSRVSPSPPAEDDINYDAIHAAVMETARGRWFLQEYAKRNRNADTGLVLAAIERMEALIREGTTSQGAAGLNGFRGELLDMARAIARTRSEIPDSRRANPAPSPADASAAAPDAVPPAAATPDPSPGIFAAAERIQEVAWTLRGRGVDSSTCDQIAALASSILGASSLRNASDSRAQKLSDVLQHLERRIHAMLHDSGGGADAPSDAVTAVENVRVAAPAAEPPTSQSAASVEPVAEAEAIAPSPVEADFDRQAAAEQSAALDSPAAEAAPPETEPSQLVLEPEPMAAARVAAEPLVLELEPLVVVPVGAEAAFAAEPVELQLTPVAVTAPAPAAEEAAVPEPAPTTQIEWGSSPVPAMQVAAQMEYGASAAAEHADAQADANKPGDVETEMLAMARAALPEPQPAAPDCAARPSQSGEDMANPALRKAPSDRLAAIRALSENERIALFS